MPPKEMTRLTLLFFATVGAASPGNWEAVELRRVGDRIDILLGGRPFTSYYFGTGAVKPYLFPLRSAQGTVVTRSFPYGRHTRRRS